MTGIIKIPVKLFPYQQNYKKRMKRFNAVAGGRRVGKTLFASTWLMQAGIESQKEGDNVWIAPTIKQSLNLGLSAFKRLVKDFPSRLIDFKETKRSLRIADEYFFFESTDNEDALRGYKLKNIVMDEAAFQKEKAYTNVIRPALADVQGNVLMISTYEGFNWFYDIMQSKEFETDCWPTELNPTIPKEEIELMRRTMGESEFRQEILAEPTTAQGLVFDKTFGQHCLIKDYVFQRDDKFAVSFDFGYNDPTVVSFYAYHILSSGMPFVVKWAEIEMRFNLIENVLIKVIEVLQLRGINPIGLPLTCDIAGKQHTGVSPATYISKIQDTKIFNVIYSKMDILHGINMLRAFFLNAVKETHFKIVSPACPQTIRDYNAYEIKKGDSPFADSKNDHFPDSDRYFFVNIIEPLLPRKQRICLNTNNGKPEMKNCLHCGKRYITFNGSNYCNEHLTEQILRI